MCLIFFFNDTATTDIYTLSLHDALPIFFEEVGGYGVAEHVGGDEEGVGGGGAAVAGDAVVAEEGFDVVGDEDSSLAVAFADDGDGAVFDVDGGVEEAGQLADAHAGGEEELGGDVGC